MHSPPAPISDDPRIADLLRLKSSSKCSVTLIGSPLRFSAQDEGQSLAACCLRRFLAKVGPLVNPQLRINITDLGVCDDGNIEVSSKNNTGHKITLEESRRQHIHYYNPNQTQEQTPFTAINHKIRSIEQSGSNTFLIGSSKSAFINMLQQNKTQSQFQSIQMKQTVSHGNCLYIGSRSCETRCFGPLSKCLEQSVVQFGVIERYMKPNKRENPCVIKLQQLRAQVDSPQSLINQLKALPIWTDSSPVWIVFSMDILSSFSSSSPCHSQGFTNEECVSIIFELGCMQQVRGIEVLGFDMKRGDWEGALIVGNLLYYYLMGVQTRKTVESVQ